jgi:hypothetical protein
LNDAFTRELAEIRPSHWGATEESPREGIARFRKEGGGALVEVTKHERAANHLALASSSIRNLHSGPSEGFEHLVPSEIPHPTARTLL